MKRTGYYIRVKEDSRPRFAHTFEGAKHAAGYPEKGWQGKIVKSSQCR